MTMADETARPLFAGYSFLAAKEVEIRSVLIAADTATTAGRASTGAVATETPGLAPSANLDQNGPQNAAEEAE